MEGADEPRDLHALGQQADRVNRLEVFLDRAEPDGPAERVGDDEGGQDRRRRAAGRPGSPARQSDTMSASSSPTLAANAMPSHRFSRCDGRARRAPPRWPRRR